MVDNFTVDNCENLEDKSVEEILVKMKSKSWQELLTEIEKNKDLFKTISYTDTESWIELGGVVYGNKERYEEYQRTHRRRND